MKDTFFGLKLIHELLMLINYFIIVYQIITLGESILRFFLLVMIRSHKAALYIHAVSIVLKW
jgi:hypothetical protein